MDIKIREELCAAEYPSENGQKILILVIYIRVNRTITNIIDFIHKQLLAYTPLGSAALRKNYDKVPMTLSGDFNVNFASNDLVLLVDDKVCNYYRCHLLEIP